MEKSSGTKEGLLEEISDLKSKIRKLEKTESQHKPADMALHTSEQKFRQLAEDMPALICTFLPDSTLTYVNTAYCKLFSKRPDELTGKKFLDFLPDEATRKNVKRQYMSLTPENPVKIYEHEVIVDDGTGKTHWHRWTDHAFFNDNGEISHFQSIGQDITESKRTQDALEESEKRYRGVFDGTPDGIIVHDVEGCILDANEAMAQRLEIAREKLIGRRIAEFTTPLNAANIAGNARNTIAGQTQIFETTYVSAAGKSIPAEVHEQRIRWKNGQAVLSISRDITRRKQAEDMLRQSEANLEEAQRIARIGSWDWDMIYNTVKSSKEMYRIFGIRPDEYDGNPESLLKVIHPDDVERVTNAVKSNASSGNPISLEFRLIHKSGSVHHIFAACRVEFNKNGRPIRNIGTAQDFTERECAESQMKAAHDELQESELFLKTLLDSVPIPVFYKDRDGRYLGFNKAFETFFGATKEKLIGKTVFDINPPDLAAIYHARDNELFASGGTQQYTSQVKNALGPMREVIFNKAVFKDSHGTISGQIGTILDITDRKRGEEALRESEENFRVLYETSPVGIEIFDTNGRLIHANPACLAIFGIASEDLVKGFDLFTDPNVSDEHKVALRRGETVRYQSQFDFEKVHDLSLYPTTRRGIIDVDVIIERLPGGNGYQVIAQDITERKQIEEVLKASETKLQAIFDTVGAGILIIDSDTHNIIEANQTAIEMIELSKESIIGRICHSFVCPAEAGKCPIKDLGQYIDHSERKLLCAEGRQKDILKTVNQVTIKGRDCYVESFIDISSRKQTEDALSQSQQQYRSLVENINDVIFTLDLQGNFTFVSPVIERLSGYTTGEVEGLPFSNFIYPDDLNRLAEAFMQTVSGIQATSEFRVLDKTGAVRWVSTRSRLVAEDGKQPVITGLMSEITARKIAEEVIREGDEKFRSVVEKSSVGIAVVDDKFLCTYVNKECCNIFGYSEQEILGKNFTFLLTEESKLLAVERYQRRQRGEDVPSVYEFSFLQKNGAKRIGEVRSSVYFDSAGKPNSLIQVIDITDRKSIEEEKRVLEERLVRSEKMEALGLMAGGVAHDLNNVLGIVVGYAEMLLSEVDEKSPLREDVVTIMDGGQRAAAIVQDMLTIARRGVSGKKVLNLNKLISDLKKSPDCDKLLSYHQKVKIKIDLDPDLLNISASSVNLDKTLFNLISNAAEAMTKGGTITIKTTNKYMDKPIAGYDTIREGDYVVLSVSDEGEGISETDLKHIFEPFYTKKIMGRSGTGLGLSVVWGTVKDHQGYIDIQSEEGKGTTFNLYFQISRENISAGDIVVSLSEYKGKGQSILVVDDVKKQRELAARMLKSLNYNVASASSGEDAIEYLKDHKIDLLVLDMIMDPGMDGLDTYKSVLKINPKQKAIIVSGFSEFGRVHDAQAIGAGAYVKKPYVIEKLGMAVKKELGNKR